MPIFGDGPIFAQVAEKHLHARGAFDGITDKLIGLGIEFTLIVSGEQLGVADNHAKRFLQVMRCRIGDVFEILVESQQHLAGFGHILDRQEESGRRRRLFAAA